jgi:undecaprenyl-diphosphatase
MVEVLILSIIQGITEFLPVSSSSHLIIISDYINFKDKGLSIDISLHLGSLLAVITYFFKDIINFINNKDLLLKILVSSLPVMLVGFILVETNIIANLRTIEIIGWTTLIFGILLYISDRYALLKNIENNFNYKSALLIGLFQVLSLVPGVSRSGITITAARLLNFKRFDAAKISFLLSIPTLTAVSLFGLRNLVVSQDLNFSILNLISIIFSFIFSIITIKFFLKYIKRFSLNLFVIYRVVLGVMLLLISYL